MTPIDRAAQAIQARYEDPIPDLRRWSDSRAVFKSIDTEEVARVLAAHRPTTGMAVTSGITCQCGYWTGEEEPGKTRPAGLGGGLMWHQAQAVKNHLLGENR